MEKYSKPFKSLQEQAELLIKRGLVGDKDEICERLRYVGYYRLSAYWYPFRSLVGGIRQDDLLPGTTITQVWNHYRFDRRLRLLLLDAIERIEVALRSTAAYRYAESQGPFGYEALLPENIREKIRISDSLKNQYDFVSHFAGKYNGEFLPVWMAVGVMDFGDLLSFLRSIDHNIRTRIAKDFGIPMTLLLSWMDALRLVRNACAHHARVWNKMWGISPKKHKAWGGYAYNENLKKWIRCAGVEFPFQIKKTGYILIICRFLLKMTSGNTKWKERVDALFDEFKELSVNSGMGLPEHWQLSPLWK